MKKDYAKSASKDADNALNLLYVSSATMVIEDREVSRILLTVAFLIAIFLAPLAAMTIQPSVSGALKVIQDKIIHVCRMLIAIVVNFAL